MRLKAIVIGVHPKWEDFYIGVIGFRKLNSEIVQHYEFANGNPVAGYYLDFEMAPLEASAVYEDQPDEKNLIKYFVVTPPPSNFVLPDRSFLKVSDPVMDPELLHQFFKVRSKVFDSLSHKDALIIRSSYPESEYDAVFSEIGQLKDVRMPDEIRLKVSCRAVLNVEKNLGQILEVNNVSMSGFQVAGELPSERFTIKIQVSETKVASVTADRVWSDGGKCGARIVKASPEWSEFINYLQKDFLLIRKKGA